MSTEAVFRGINAVDERAQTKAIALLEERNVGGKRTYIIRVEAAMAVTPSHD